MAVPNLVQIHPQRLWANGWNITNLKKNVYTLFGNSLTDQTHQWIITLDGSNNADLHKGVPFGSFIDIAPRFGGESLPPQKNFGGVDKCFHAKQAKYWNFHIIESTALISTKFC